MNFAGILAAGKGTRMGNTPMPKQFLEVGNKPIIIHTIDQFFISEYIDKIIVAVPSQWIDYASDIINSYYNNNDKIEIIKGSDERNKSIISICNHINENYSLEKSDIIVTHDAVRPFINQRIIEDNVKSLMENDFKAVDTVITATDTIVESIDGEIINSIPIRNNMYQGQTPQTFYINEFIDLYDSLDDKEKNSLTDAIRAYVIKDFNVGLVKGDQMNFKVTTLFDLTLARVLLDKEGESNDI